MIQYLRKLLLFGILVSNLQLATSSSALTKFLNHPKLNTASVSIMVKNLETGKVIASHNSNKAMITASTIKAVTTATALEILGGDYQHKTYLAIDGNIDSGGVLQGNLYLIGMGDPTLGSEKIGNQNFFDEWIRAIALSGIQAISGKLIAVESCFSDQVIHPHWTWEDMGNYYASGVHAISYRDNMYRIYFRSGNVGTTPEIVRTEPYISGLSFSNNVKSSTTKSDQAYIYGAPFQYNRSIYGEIPANKSEFIIRGDMPHPAVVLLNEFKSALQVSGIESDEIEIQHVQPANIRIIHTHLSPPLREIIKVINQDSNNQFAEYLYKQLSLHANGIGSFQASRNITKACWENKGFDTTALFQFDGSGLSRQNAASASFMVHLMEYMYKTSKNAFDFKSSLAVSGTSGTFKNFMNTSAMRGKVYGKSGTISMVRSYTGYVDASKGTLAFAVLVNHAHASSRDVAAIIEQFLTTVATKN